MSNFFISHHQNDRNWAEWIAWRLEENGYSVEVQPWDFPPGSNFVIEMQRITTVAERMIAVLSPTYMESGFCFSEWTVAFGNDPKGEGRKLIPIMVKPCNLTGLFSTRVYINLVDVKDEREAVRLLLEGVDTEKRSKPSHRPVFPIGEACLNPYFPNDSDTALYDKYIELVRQEFCTVIDRRTIPNASSNSCKLLYGHQFPFGKDEIHPQISRCAVAYDVEQFLSATVGNYEALDTFPVRSCKPHVIYKAASTRWRVLVSIVAMGLNEFRSDLLILPFLEGLDHRQHEINLPLRLLEASRRYAADFLYQSDYSLSTQVLWLLGVICGYNGVTAGDMLAEEQKNYRHHALRADTERPTAQALASAVVKIYFKDHMGAYEQVLHSLAERHINIINSRSWTLVPIRVASCELPVSVPQTFNLSEELSYLFNRTAMHREVYSWSTVC